MFGFGSNTGADELMMLVFGTNVDALLNCIGVNAYSPMLTSVSSI